MPTIRAIAQVLNERRGMVMLVGVRAQRATAREEQLALSKAFAVARALQTLTRRAEVAETVAFSAVADQPRAAATGIGFLVRAAPRAPR
jgi:hypothetical protein